MTRELQNDILKWDVKSWLKPLRYWDNNVDWSNVNETLEIGAENAGLTLWLALKGKKVMCTDIGETKQKAMPLHKKYKVEHLIEYMDADATNLPFENRFDLIVFKSVIGGIGREGNGNEQQLVIHQLHKALKPGGVLLFAENLTGSALHRYFRRKFRKWGNSWRYPTLNEMEKYLSVFSKVNLFTTGVAGTFGKTEKQKRFMAGVDAGILNHLTPKKWKYISYGIAVK